MIDDKPAGAHSVLIRFALPPLACALPLVPLINVQRTFSSDWTNHVWTLAYTGEYFLAHAAFPTVVNTSELAGMPNFLFYGGAFYAVGGILSTVLGPDLAIRALVFALLLWQFIAVRNVVGRVTSSALFSNTAASLVTWAIYPLTNLYNRGALTEFVAGCCLTVAACRIVSSALDHDSRALPLVEAGLAFAFAASAHPLTGIYGGFCLFLLLLLVCLLFKRNSRFMALAAAQCAMLAMIFGPWVYLLHSLGQKLPVLNMVAIGISGYDGFWTRIAPFPYDAATIRTGINNVSTIYLDAQLNTPLLVYVIGAAIAAFYKRAFRRSRGLWLFSFGSLLFTLTFIASVSAFCNRLLQHLINPLQFTYRLVLYENLALLIAFVGLLLLQRGTFLKPSYGSHFCAVVLTVAVLGVIIKWNHAYVMPPGVRAWGKREVVQRTPATYYAMGNYLINECFPEIPKGSPWPPLEIVPAASRFGDVAPMMASVDKPTTIVFKVALFPWNKILLDGRHLGCAELRSFYGLHAFILQPGKHSLAYVFEPDRIWSMLRIGSRFGWLLWFAWLVWLRAKPVTQGTSRPGRESATTLARPAPGRAAQATNKPKRRR